MIILSILSISQYMIAQNAPKENLETTLSKNDIEIKGQVVDAKSNENLQFIYIIVEGTTIGTSTDAAGNFSINNLPEGKLTLKASAVGYLTQTKEVDLKRGSTIDVQFSLVEDAIMLQGTVVSANRSETNRSETSTLVGLLTPVVFERMNAVSLSDGLNFQPGLRVETNCQNCGFQQVRINGLDGAYSQILIDSRPITSALAGVYGLEQIPVSMIERVEVIRGAGSALFGANAVGGTINIITKEALTNSLSVGNSTTLIGMNTADVNTNINASLVTEDNKAGIAIFASTRNRGAYDANGDGFSEIAKLNSKNLGFRSYYRTSSNTKLSLEYHTINEYRRGGNKFELQPHQADIAESVEHDINSLGARYDIFMAEGKHWMQIYTSFQHINRDSYYGSGQDLNAYGKTKDVANVNGLQYVWRMDNFLFMPASLTGGVEHNYSYMKDDMPGYNKFTQQTINTYSTFLQNEWKNEKLTFLLGGRLDHNSLIKKAIFSPRVNVRYTPKKWVALRVGYATGFRAPQVFNEDLHIETLGDGVVRYIENDVDLRPERSHSLNISADFNGEWNGGGFTFLTEGFYTKLNDVFLLEETGVDELGNVILTRKNGSGASVAGLNFEGNVIPMANMNVQFGFTAQRSLYDEPEVWTDNVEAQRKMFRTPDNYGFLSLGYTPIERFDISMTGTYTGSMLIKHYEGYIEESREEVTPEFFDLGFKLNYGFNIGEGILLEVNGGMKNLFNSYQKTFDIGELRDPAYIYGPSLPRSVFMGLKISW